MLPGTADSYVAGVTSCPIDWLVELKVSLIMVSCRAYYLMRASARVSWSYFI